MPRSAAFHHHWGVRCFVTAGPTWEPLDRARRLTNFSTGRLGGELANALQCAGHDVELFLSETAVWRAPLAAVIQHPFSTTASLAAAIQARATDDRVAFFHAAAVSDFRAGRLLQRGPDGEMAPVSEGKPQTDRGSLFVELCPTPKILPQLRGWFPRAWITGWKYEVDGGPDEALRRGWRQLEVSGNDCCVVNGPAYGRGFAIVGGGRTVETLDSKEALLQRLVARVDQGLGS